MGLPQEVRAQIEYAQHAKGAMDLLKMKGLLKIGKNNEMITPSTVEEQISFREENNRENREALIMEIQNRELERNAADQERKRPSLQLEVNEQ